MATRDPVKLRRAQQRYRLTDKNKVRQRRQDLRKKFGITIEEWEALAQKQNGQCAICGVLSQQYGPSGRRLCVDHDHTTGKIRGLLCTRCNAAIERVEKYHNWGALALSYLGV